MIHQISDKQIMISEEENEDSYDEDDKGDSPDLIHNQEIEEVEESPRKDGCQDMDEGSDEKDQFESAFHFEGSGSGFDFG